jgi:hypothetical protein
MSAPPSPNFVKEAHQRFGRMVGADHDATPRAGNRVLRDHPLARLDVAEDEVFLKVIGVLRTALLERREHLVRWPLGVDGERFVGTHELQRELRVFLIALRAVRQPDRNGMRLVAARAKTLDAQLRETPAVDESTPPLMPSTYV